MTNKSDLKNAIIKTGIYLLENKLVKGTGGNISARTDAGFLVTPSGMDYNHLTPEDIVEMDLTGKILSGKRVPSIEKEMHRAVYLKRSDVGAIVHVHSTYATSVAAARKSLPAITDNQVAVFGGTVNIADYGPIGSSVLARNVTSALGGYGMGVLLSNHGALCVGKTLDEALFRCEMLEEIAKIYVMAKLLGGGIPLNKSEIDFESADLRKRYGQDKA
jgi:L-fuculose-phosphate aldolase